jgi:hypothetical protein
VLVPDMEDSVPLAEKASARQAIASLLPQLAQMGAHTKVLPRVNSLDTGTCPRATSILLHTIHLIVCRVCRVCRVVSCVSLDLGRVALKGLMEDDLQAVIAQGDVIFGVSVGKVQGAVFVFVDEIALLARSLGLRAFVAETGLVTTWSAPRRWAQPRTCAGSMRS